MNLVNDLHSLFHKLPELIEVPFTRQRHVYQVYSDDAKVQATIILGLPRLIIKSLGYVVISIAGFIWS